VAVTVTKNRKLLSKNIIKNPVKSQLPPNFIIAIYSKGFFLDFLIDFFADFTPMFYL
jgi:hypothetical protein